MKAIRLHGPRDLRLDTCAEPPEPADSEVVIAVGSVGICGSDLHLFEYGRIGSTVGEAPFVPGHEFMGRVIAAGSRARDGQGQPLRCGMRVAVDPQVPCLRCEWCEAGHPNLCPHHRFFGLYPTDGALGERLLVPARNCFALPDDITDDGGAVLETLGVALHAVDLAGLRIGRSCAVLGCGAVGLLLVRLAHLAGARPLIAVDPLPWRTALARLWGATDVITARAENALDAAGEAAGRRGCDVVFESGWVGPAAQAAADLATPGGRIVMVGIPADDALTLTHSVARRKGLTLLFSRRMKHVYPRAIALTSGPEPRVDLGALVTHGFPLAEAAQAFALSAAYREGVIKAVVRPQLG